MGIRAYYVNGLSNVTSDKSGKGDVPPSSVALGFRVRGLI